MVKDINEIGLEYAEEHGGGLPLSAKEFCNALALWVQKNCVLKNEQGETMTVNELEKLLQGSDSITLYNNGQKIVFSLNAELVSDISKSLKLPVSNPTETELVGVDELGQQVMIPRSQVSKLYEHRITLKAPDALDIVTYLFITRRSEPYTYDYFAAPNSTAFRDFAYRPAVYSRVNDGIQRVTSIDEVLHEDDNTTVYLADGTEFVLDGVADAIREI